MRLAKFISLFRNGSVQPHEKTTRDHRVRLRLEELERREVPALNPTGFEQEMLELMNRMRIDPAGELGRLLISSNPPRSADAAVQAALNYYQVNGATLTSQWGALRPAAPLAWNEGLMNSSRTHTLAMIAADQQSHQLPGEPALGTRIRQGGYTGWTRAGENIFAYALGTSYAHAAFTIDWGVGPGGMQSPAGHRINMMNADYREVGISVLAESLPDTQVGPLVITEDFGNRSNLGNAYLLGVAYRDGNGNGRYEAGEGLGGVQVRASGTAGSWTVSTMTAGGYQMQLPPGTYTVTFSGASLPSTLTRTVTIGSANVKIDAVAEVGGGGGVTNHAPVLNTTASIQLATIAPGSANPPGTQVGALVGAAISDPDPGALRGIALTPAGGSSGVWQYSLDSGRTWANVPVGGSNSGLLLSTENFVRFIPAGGFSGDALCGFRAWDQTSGRAGSVASLAVVGADTAFSSASGLLRITVGGSVNRAPVLNPNVAFVLGSVNPNSANQGTLVSTLLGGGVSDPDAGAVSGIAVVGLGGTANGTWQYSLDQGRTWRNFGTASTSTARLLRGTDLLRFVPKPRFSGQVSLQFRAWDQTMGVAGGTVSFSGRLGVRVGGTSAFSSSVGTGLLRVS